MGIGEDDDRSRPAHHTWMEYVPRDVVGEVETKVSEPYPYASIQV